MPTDLHLPGRSGLTSVIPALDRAESQLAAAVDGSFAAAAYLRWEVLRALLRSPAADLADAQPRLVALLRQLPDRERSQLLTDACAAATGPDRLALLAELSAATRS